MPQIIVVADGCDRRDKPVMFTERVSVRDFESRHFQVQLVERLGWAVGDAHAAEQTQGPDEQDQPSGEHRHGQGWDDVAPIVERERESLSGARPVS